MPLQFQHTMLLLCGCMDEEREEEVRLKEEEADELEALDMAR